MDPNKTPETPWFRELRLELEGRGKAEGKQEALLVLFSTRELPVSAVQRKRIQACADPDVLDRWLRAAVNADSVDEVLAPPRARRKPAATPVRPASRRRASRA